MKPEEKQKLLETPSSKFYLWLWKHKKLSKAQKDKLAKWYEINKVDLKDNIRTLFM